ncbi:MAG: hypothetical protein IPM45_18500 [Acidimicrobiales bacterium]|nr:hypothetical protein [Acidimicrobiales bacterium]
MITVAGAMEDGLIDPDTPIDVPHQLLVGDHWFSDHDPHGVPPRGRPQTSWSRPPTSARSRSPRCWARRRSTGTSGPSGSASRPRRSPARSTGS